MNKMARKPLSWLLTLSLLLGLLSVTAFGEGGDVVSVTIGETTTNYATLTDALTSWTNGSTLTLLANVETTDYVLSDRVHTLDLNGHGIAYVGADNSDSVLKIFGGTLTVKDSGTGSNTVYIDENGRGSLSGTGEGVTVGGFLTGGKSGGVFVSSGTLILEGGTILGNLHGGGVGGAGVRVNNGAAFEMRGGLITRNTSVGAGGGVGVCAKENAQGSFTMTGGAITGNTAALNGAGVILQPGAVFELGGTAQIAGNTPDNVWLPDGFTLAVTEALDESASIGITMQTPGVFTASENTALNVAARFTGDSAYCAVEPNTDGQLTLTVLPHDHAWSYTADGATLTAKCPCGETATLTLTAPTALTYDGGAKAAALGDYSAEAFPDAAIAYAKGGAALDGAPVGAGSYTASVTFSGATASVSYTVARKPFTPTEENVEFIPPVTPNGQTPTVKLWDGETVIPASEYKVAIDGEEHEVIIRNKTGGNYAIETAYLTYPASEGTATVTRAPAASEYTYDAAEHPLLATAGTASNGTLVYALGTAAEATEPYSASIPAATNAGT